jgi:tRNA (guanine-N7-)-methyltransferase
MSSASDEPTDGHRGPRTYVRRRGRMTRGQARAMDALAGRYLLDSDRAEPLDVVAEFGRSAPLGLEIGFGMGHGLIAWAQERPDWNLLGVEIYEPGVGAALLGLEREGLDHVRLLQAPAEHVLEHRLAPATVDEVRIFFPDPWPKARHHKRRLVQPEFIRLLVNRMRTDALLWVATDWDDYAEWMVAVLDAEPALYRVTDPLVIAADAAVAFEPVHGRPRTRFEARGIRLGHRLWDLRYRRNSLSTASR